MTFLTINRLSPVTCFWLSALLVWVASFATILKGYPCLLSPLCFVIALPALIMPIPYLLGPLVGPIIYIAWCFPLLKGQTQIPLRSKIFSALFVVLSLTNLVASWRYGTQYEGVFQTIAVYVFNGAFWIGLFIAERNSRTNPTFIKNLGFHTLLFCWLTWVAFPWLGELP
jgi:hypothetical protein